MGQFALHRNPNPRTRDEVPFLLDVQSDLVSGLATRMVVPLHRIPGQSGRVMARLTPVLAFEGMALVAMVPEMAGIARRDLGEVVGDLAGSRQEIMGAVDLLLTGF